MKPRPRPSPIRPVSTDAIDGCGMAHRMITIAASSEMPAPSPSTTRGPYLSVRRPDMGAPTPDASPSAMTR